MGLVFAVLALTLAAIELPLMVRRRAGAKRTDRGSFWFVQASGLALVAAVAWIVFDPRFAFARVGLWSSMAGIFLFVNGAAIRIAAIRALGKYFTVTVQTSPDQPVIDTGPYKLIRHPSYTGLLMEGYALGLATCNLLALAVIVVASTLPLVYRIRVEEEALATELGEPYRAYMARTKRLVPFLF